MNKFNITLEFAEELGAYLEGNLSLEDNYRIDELISTNEDLQLLVDDISCEDLQLINRPLSQQELLDCGFNFELPDVPFDLFNCVELPQLNIEQHVSFLDDLSPDNNISNGIEQYNEDYETDYNINDLI